MNEAHKFIVAAIASARFADSLQGSDDTTTNQLLRAYTESMTNSLIAITLLLNEQQRND